MNQQHSVATSSLAQGEDLSGRSARALGTAALALMLGVAFGGVANAQTAPAGVPDKSFPESVTSTKDGTLYAGSFNLGGVCSGLLVDATRGAFLDPATQKLAPRAVPLPLLGPHVMTANAASE